MKRWRCLGIPAKLEKNKYMPGIDIDVPLSENRLKKIVKRLSGRFHLSDTWVKTSIRRGKRRGHLILFPYDVVSYKKFLAIMKATSAGCPNQLLIVEDTGDFFYRFGGKYKLEKVIFQKVKGSREPGEMQRIAWDEGIFPLLTNIAEEVMK